MCFQFRRAVITEMCKHIELTGGLDFWWTVPVSDLVKDESIASDLVKGQVSDCSKKIINFVLSLFTSFHDFFAGYL